MVTKNEILVEKRNSEIFLRPRFSIDLLVNENTILKRFENAFKQEDCKLLGKIVDGHIFISVAKSEEHFWSPQLHLEIVAKNDNSSVLKGLFGPKPQVWTLFMFIHFVVGIAFLGFGVLLYTKISLNEDFVYPLVMMIFLPIFWIVLYLLGNIGKDKGKKQMTKLHDFMLKVIAQN